MTKGLFTLKNILTLSLLMIIYLVPGVIAEK